MIKKYKIWPNVQVQTEHAIDKNIFTQPFNNRISN